MRRAKRYPSLLGVLGVLGVKKGLRPTYSPSADTFSTRLALRTWELSLNPAFTSPG
jgi:hypothetical protein